MDDSQWIPVLTIIVSVLTSLLFGSVAAAVTAHFLTSHRNDKELRLSKLEALYMRYGMRMQKISAKEIFSTSDYPGDKPELFLKEFDTHFDLVTNLIEIKCICHIYFESLWPHVQDFDCKIQSVLTNIPNLE